MLKVYTFEKVSSLAIPKCQYQSDKLQTSCNLSATAKNVSPFTYFGGIASNLVWGILRGTEL